MPKYNRRRVSVLLSSQTLFHLENMAQFSGHKDLGRVIDKLVREKRLDLNESTREGVRDHATNECQNRRQNR
jgi:hypothetical protein